MKNLVVAAAVIVGLYLFFTWKPSTEAIVMKMDFGEQLVYDGETYRAEWSEKELVKGYLRRIDRHYDKLIPIVTYSMVVTTEDFNNPDIVEINHKGGGNYYWRSKTKPKGDLTVYHTIPGSVMVQQRMDVLAVEADIEMSVRVATKNSIKGDSGPLFRVGGNGHKIVLVEEIL